MVEELGEIGEKVITNGMLVEHNIGRLYLSDIELALKEYKKTRSLESKLEIISNLVCYTNFIKRHADKENNAIYPFGEKKLSKDTLVRLNEETMQFDEETTKTREECLSILKNFINKYF